MADTYTPNYGWTMPQVGGDPDTWGGLLNTNFDDIDSVVFGIQTTANGALPKAGGTMTGALNLTPSVAGAAIAITGLASANNTSDLTITDIGANGANLRLMGPGATTPSKTLRVNGGDFFIMNDAETGTPLTLTDAGALTVTGAFSASSASLTGQLTITETTPSIELVGSGGADTWYIESAGTGSTPGAGAFFIYNSTTGYWAAIGPQAQFTLNGTSPEIVLANTASGGDTWYIESTATSGPSGAGHLFFYNNNTGSEVYFDTSSVVWAGDFAQTSDPRLKDEIKPLRRGLDELKRMIPREYVKYQSEADLASGYGGKEEIGFLAPEVAEVIPEAVGIDGRGYQRVSPMQTLALIASAVLDLDHRLTLAGI